MRPGGRRADDGPGADIDVHEAAVSRFYPSPRTPGSPAPARAESFNKMYGIVHPAEQYESGRPLRGSPAVRAGEGARRGVPRDRALGAAALVRVQRAAAGDVRRPADGPAAEWDSRWWSPIINAEHLAMRDGAGWSTCPRSPSSTSPARGRWPGCSARRGPARRAGRPDRLHAVPQRGGGFVADLTIMRLGASHFRVVTGAADGGRDAQWISDRLPDDAQLADVSSAWSTIGLWGPRAPGRPRAAKRDDVSRPGPFGMLESLNLAARSCSPPASPTWASSAGSCTCPPSRPGTCGTCCWRRARPHGLVPVGIGVYGTTGRLEKGYRAFGAELTGEYNPVEAGMTRPRVKSADFIGKEEYLAARAAPPAAVLCTLTVDDQVARRRDAAVPARRRADPAAGRVAAGGRARAAVVRDLGRVGAVGRPAPADGVPAVPVAEVGTPLLAEYMGEQYPVTVASHGAPCSTRRRADAVSGGGDPGLR